MRSEVRIIHSPNKAIKEIEKLAKSLQGVNRVKVGLPKNSNPYPDGTSVIMVGAVHEFGSPSHNIPERSFLRSTLHEKRPQYRRLFKKLSKSIVEGKRTMVQSLGILGLTLQKDIVNKIIDLKSPPNTKETIRRKGSSNPLNDTGHLKQSITYVVSE